MSSSLFAAETAMTDRVILNADEMRRALSRMAHEIVEQNGGVDDLVLVGLRTRGVPLAERIQRAIAAFEHAEVPCGKLDVTLYRDDLFAGRIFDLHETAMPSDVSGTTVVVVDDVLYTGRTIRAALDAVMDFGRPRAIEVAVLVDRGHRELPIRANFVGKNVPTARDELVAVHVQEIDGRDEVVIWHPDGSEGANRPLVADRFLR
jgi:pyrimidine operon attenuation protein/uracil phosphoribosyltransferase